MVNVVNKMNDNIKTWVDPMKETDLELLSFLEGEYKAHTVYPKPEYVLNAIRAFPYNDLRVVILGQDPYHTPATAHGLAFSSEGEHTPPSLRNIYKEIRNDLYPEVPLADLFKSNNLTSWANQGVLLLNTILTVREGEPLSHANQGWEGYTARIIRKANFSSTPIVFLLWGSRAKAYSPYLDHKKHRILTAGHPSPLSERFFLGCKHFSKCNAFLEQHYGQGIDWRNP